MGTDYSQKSFLFKLKKVVRYVRLFGISRTLMKIKGQYHNRSAETFDGEKWINKACKTPRVGERKIAIIGCGNFAFSNIAYYLGKECPHFLRATYDIHKGRGLSLCKTFGGAYATSDWQEIVADPHVNLVYIASNHASHAEYAIAFIDAGKNVHIEKPHVVSHAQLGRLVAVMGRNPQSKVFLGFNRPKSSLFLNLQLFLAKEAGPLMINWFIVGHELPGDHWYFDEQEGGRILGNLCHWTDMTLRLVSIEKAFPCTIIPATPPSSKSDFVVSVVFADHSCASLTFSAKGGSFEGVRETLNVHKGNVLASLVDFGRLTIDIGERKQSITNYFRDHGHQQNIIDALHRVDTDTPGESALYLAATARFFLAIRDAIESGEKIVLDRV